MAQSTTPRPLALGEQMRAFGHPWQRPLTLFISLQSVMLYLKHNNIPAGKNWWPSKWHFLRFCGYLGAAQLVGWSVSMIVFRDATAFRLHKQHLLDAYYSVGFDSPESGLLDTVPEKPTKVWDLEQSPKPLISVADWKKEVNEKEKQFWEEMKAQGKLPLEECTSEEKEEK